MLMINKRDFSRNIIDNEMFLLDSYNGIYYHLNSTANEMWIIMEKYDKKDFTIEQLGQLLAVSIKDKYQISEQKAIEDTRKFVERMRDIGAILFREG